MSQTSNQENDILFTKLMDVEYTKLREELSGKEFNPSHILQLLARAEVAIEGAYGMIHGLLSALQDQGIVFSNRADGKFEQSQDFTPTGKFDE